MKKYLLIGLCLTLVFLTGCSVNLEKGNYKEGTYEGSVIDPYNNENNIASAKVTVDKDGYITDVYLDTTYTSQDGTATTKKTLGDDYNMKKYNPSASGEWYEQVEKLEHAIVENQGVDFITLDGEGKTDAVSGCTIVVNALVSATSKALEQAK